ncbi:MAG: hypothetical protein FD180_2823 [Planctomycetota bacterium]|nr:MAG: hypothetical protein FD180_2823 [Planctomycetota bacterium]
MTPSPIRKVLSTFSRHRVRALLMGGQACIVYGGAEFSRDVDLAVDPTESNLRRVRAALSALKAEPAYFPPLSSRVLRRGHACHFRCRVPEAHGLRVDLRSKMRGVAGFPVLWNRRVERKAGQPALRIKILSLPDLVRAKKTQRDKDWPMIRRMIDAEIVSTPRPQSARVKFWLKECRTPEVLIDLVREFRQIALREARTRAAVREAMSGDPDRVYRELRAEEDRERREDRTYWTPLMRELESQRLGRHS